MEDKIKQVGKDVSFFLRNRKRIIRISVFVAVVTIMIIILYRVFLHVFFLVMDDLIVVVSPADYSKQMLYSETQMVPIQLEVRNSLFCGASCTYSFTDISTGEVIEEGVLESPLEEFEKQFTISGGHRGKGQKLYSFIAACHNIRTWHCLSNEKVRERSSFIVVDYDLSETEQQLAESLRSEIENASIFAENLGNELVFVQQRMNNISLEGNQPLKQQLLALQLRYEKATFSLYEAADYLADNNFEETRNTLNSQDNISDIRRSVLLLNTSISMKVGQKNRLTRAYNQLGLQLSNFSAVATNGTLTSAVEVQFQKMRSLKNMISSDDANASLLAEQIFDETKSIHSELNQSLQKEVTFGTYYGALESKRICLARNSCGQYNYPINYDDFAAIMIDRCDSFNTIRVLFDEASSVRVKNITEFAKEQLYQELVSINSPILNEINITFEEVEKPQMLEENESIALLSETALFFWEHCMPMQKIESLPLIEEPSIAFQKVTLNVSVQEQQSRCCVLGECESCCESCSTNASLYPVLFIHGHSFNSKNSPDYSLDAFDSLQDTLANEGYVFAGTITPISSYVDVRYGDWGRIQKPIMVKGSFYRLGLYDLGSYLITTQKSENIETYAIRLKEMVELLKFRSGKDKVIIVSHSMGGLVARSYLQIFGDSSIDKVIMIGTPNQGIREPIVDYCSFLGEKKECADMTNGSIFLRNLNGPHPLPKSKIYSIIGSGCSMDLGRGDGVVLEKDAHLNNVTEYMVNGTCDGFSRVFHTEMTDMEKYPMIKEIILKVLRE